MTDPDHKPASFILSAVGCFVLAALLIAVGWWAMSGFLAGQHDLSNLSSTSSSGAPQRRNGPGVLSFLGFVGLAAFLGAALFTGIGIAVIYKGALSPRKRAEAQDESWRNMPAPSDAPMARRPTPPRR